MDYSVDYDQRLDVVVATTRGAFTVDEISKLVNDLIVELRSRGTASLLADHSESSTVELPTPEIRKISELARQLSEPLHGKRFAVVFATDLDYGMGRMWQALTENSVPFEIRIFRNLAEARAWLAGSGSSSKTV